MIYTADYFELQAYFAGRVSDITHIPLEDALFSYTAFWKIMGNPGWDFKNSTPLWQEFIRELRYGEYPALVAQALYQKHGIPPEESRPFGCFSYEYVEKDKVIMVHFKNVDSPEPGALSRRQMEIRKDELHRMFTEVQEKYPDATFVTGFSWLYNIEAYRRLFPSEYIATAQSKHRKNFFVSLAQWGQFFDSSGSLKGDAVMMFKEKVCAAQTIDALVGAFRYDVLEPRAPISFFYEQY